MSRRVYINTEDVVTVNERGKSGGPGRVFVEPVTDSARDGVVVGVTMKEIASIGARLSDEQREQLIAALIALRGN